MLSKKPSSTNVLVVEPDELLAKTYRRILTDSGYYVRSSTNAQDAIIDIDSTKPDVILVEIQLRLHNGIELLNEIRSYPDLSEIPIIVLTYVPEASFSSLLNDKQLKIVKYLYKSQATHQDILFAVQEALAQ
ncbi:MAG: response regulator [Candidatus Saccharimonadales bacterium]